MDVGIIDTKFLLVNEYQYRENYAFIEVEGKMVMDSQNPYWKYKGGSDVLVAELSLEAAQCGTEALRAMVDAQAAVDCKPNGCAEYDLIDWRLEERSQAVYDKCCAFVEGYLSDADNYNTEYFSIRWHMVDALGVSEILADWAIDLMIERKFIVTSDSSYPVRYHRYDLAA
jgi:hypothetical protein